MKAASDALKAHLAQDVTTITLLIRLSRIDGTVLGFTTHDQDIQFEGVLYKASSAVMPSGSEYSSNLSVDNSEFKGVLDGGQIQEQDVVAGFYANASIDVFIVNWADLTMGAMWRDHAKLGNISIKGLGYTAEVRGMQQPLSNTSGRVLTPECPKTLGSTGKFGCRANISSLTIHTEVTGAGDRFNFVCADAAAKADGFYRYGRVTWLTGQNAGVQVEVRFHTGANISLTLPAGYPIAVGDQFSLRPGCDKLLTTCRDKFDNVANFGGFPAVKGRDAITKYPTATG